jgi:hypothetical protein
VLPEKMAHIWGEKRSDVGTNCHVCDPTFNTLKLGSYRSFANARFLIGAEAPTFSTSYASESFYQALHTTIST